MNTLHKKFWGTKRRGLFRGTIPVFVHKDLSVSLIQIPCLNPLPVRQVATVRIASNCLTDAS